MRLANFALAWQKDEDVAGSVAGQFVGGGQEGSVQIPIGGLGIFDGSVADLNWPGSARDLNNRGAMKPLGKAFGLQGSRGQDEFQIRSARQDVVQKTEQEVDVEGSRRGRPSTR